MSGNQELPPAADQHGAAGVENVVAALLFVRDSLSVESVDAVAAQFDEARESVRAAVNGASAPALISAGESLNTAHDRLGQARAALGMANSAFASYGVSIGAQPEASRAVEVPVSPAPIVKEKPQRVVRPRDFKLSYLQIRQGLDPVFGRLLAQLPYNYLAAQTRRAVRRGNESALYAPVTQVLVDATLSILELPYAVDRLPLEVADRAAIAQYFADRAAKIGTEARLFQSFYEGNAYLAPLLTDEDRHAIVKQPEYLGSLGSALFSDVSIVGGGAARALQEHGVEGDYADIIANSPDLLTVAGVPKASAAKMVRFLGAPYAAGRHYVIDSTGERPVVRFTDDARAFIRNLFKNGSGCPARQLQAEDDEHRTVLDKAWSDVVHFLLPPGATVNG
ncbi:MAG TPA: hypothetical protein VLH86_00805 [Patescibacteria group bacterium]|nr:hypothetical protein [Patescibacteria group bacterium]